MKQVMRLLYCVSCFGKRMVW